MQQVGLEGPALNLLDMIVSLSEAGDEWALLRNIAHFVGNPSPHLLTLGYLNETEQAGEIEVEAVAQIMGNGERANETIASTTHFAASVLTANEAGFIEDMSALPLPLVILPSERFQSAVVLPMYANNRWQGIIAIGWLEKRTFSSIERNFFNALPRPIAATIASRRAYHAEETARRVSDERARELETVTKVSAIVARILNLDELLPTVCDLTQANFSLYHVNIYLLSDDEQNMVLVAGAGEIGRMLKSRRYSVPLSRKRSLLAVAVQKRETIIVDDVAKSPDFLPNPLTPHTRSEMVIPVIIGSALIGALVVQGRELKRFDEQDIPVMTALSDQIAVAVQNARLFAEQQRIVEELRALDKLKSQFMANMSHELRTPLNSILNYTEFVASGVFGAVNAKQADALNKSVTSGEHLLSLINDILDLTKIESGMMELFIEEFDLKEVVQDVNNMAEGLLVEKSVKFVCEVDNSLPVISADRRRIQQILVNLVSNAIKFTSQGSVTLSAALEGNDIHFIVQDTGPGIAPEDQSLIFESFRQTQQGLQKGSGTGLGLPISKHLAEAHGGKLWLTSEVGVGSQFHVIIPAQRN